MKWSQEKIELLRRDVVVPPSTDARPNTEGLVQAMS
jgi:hypothetical protein